MARLIDADALIAEVENNINTYWNEAGGGYYLAEDALNESIRTAPTVDAVEVKHGRWIDHLVRDWRCSECGEKIHKVRQVDGYCYDDMPNYCPKCGAKMDGDVE